MVQIKAIETYDLIRQDARAYENQCASGIMAACCGHGLHDHIQVFPSRVCVCEREREKERESERERERERERECVCVREKERARARERERLCVWVCVCERESDSTTIYRASRTC